MTQLPPKAELFEQILNSLDSGVIVADAQARIVMANSAAYRHLAADAEVIAPGVPLASVPGGPSFVTVFKELAETNASVNRRDIIVSETKGVDRDIGLSAYLLEGGADFNGVIFLFIDMTQWRALEREAEVNRHLAAIGQLTAGVVHEIKNPLSIISGLTELALRHVESGSKPADQLNKVLKEVTLLNKTIVQFLGFARPYETRKGPCTLEMVLDRAVQLSQFKAQDKGITVEYEHPAMFPEFRADPVGTPQALANIITNAIEILPEGGHVWVKSRATNTRIIFEIHDDGPGIDVKPGENLFSPFVSKKKGGTGLGLAIVHKIVSAQNGQITYQNRPEGGACFRVELPRTD